MTAVRTELEVCDERFRCHGDEWMERLYTGCRWVEGPVYVPAGRYLLFDDVPNDRMLRWDETSRTRGRFDLVHRSQLRDRLRLRGLSGRERDRWLPRPPDRPGHR